MPVTDPLRHPLTAPRTQRCIHFFLQHHLDDLPHSLSNRCLQPLSQRTLLAHFHCSASLRHGVFLLCPEPLAEILGLSPSMTSQENTPSTFLQESGQNLSHSKSLFSEHVPFRLIRSDTSTIRLQPIWKRWLS